MVPAELEGGNGQRHEDGEDGRGSDLKRAQFLCSVRIDHRRVSVKIYLQ